MTNPVWKGPWVVRHGRGSTTYGLRWKGPPDEDGVTKTHTRGLGRFDSRAEAERAAEIACAEHGLAIAPPGHPHHPPEPGRATKPITFRLRAQAELRWTDLEREAAALRAYVHQSGARRLEESVEADPPPADSPVLQLGEEDTLFVQRPNGEIVRVAGAKIRPGILARCEVHAMAGRRRAAFAERDAEWDIGDCVVSEEVWGFVTAEYAESSWKNRKSQLRQLAAHLAPVPLKAFRSRHVEDYKRIRRRQGLSACAVNHELQMLVSVLKFAARMDWITSVPEVRRARWKGPNERRRRALTVDEYERLLAAAEPATQLGVTRGRPPLRLSPLIHLQILLGVEALLRPGEICHVAWECMRLTSPVGTLALVDRPEVGFRVKSGAGPNKPGKERTVPMSKRLTAAMKRRWNELGRPREGWVFPSPKNPDVPVKVFRRALDAACEAAEVERIRPVELRHTGATFAVHERGFKVPELMAMGGWSSPQIPLTVYVKQSTKGAEAKLRAEEDPANPEGRVIDLRDVRRRRAK